MDSWEDTSLLLGTPGFCICLNREKCTHNYLLQKQTNKQKPEKNRKGSKKNSSFQSEAYSVIKDMLRSTQHLNSHWFVSFASENKDFIVRKRTLNLLQTFQHTELEPLRLYTMRNNSPQLVMRSECLCLLKD